MESIPWINDYQPITPIQDDDGDGIQTGYDYRRDKIHNPDVFYGIGNDPKTHEAKKDASRPATRDSLFRARKNINTKRKKSSGDTREGEERTKRNIASISKLDRLQISPVKLQKMMSNNLKRLIIARLKLLNLSAMGRGNNKKRILLDSLGEKLVTAKRNNSLTSLSKKMIPLNFRRIKRGMVLAIAGKPKIEGIKLEPLKKEDKKKKIKKIPDIKKKVEDTKEGKYSIDKIIKIEQLKLKNEKE